MTVASQLVRYSVGDTEASFVVDPDEWEGWRDAGANLDRAVSSVTAAVRPAVSAARAVLDQVREIKPGSVEVKFGITVTGGTDWAVAKAGAEASFEITLTWPGPPPEAGASSTAA